MLGYCEGGDLGAVMARRKGKFFEESQLRLWLAQLLLALIYLEKKNVIQCVGCMWGSVLRVRVRQPQPSLAWYFWLQP